MCRKLIIGLNIFSIMIFYSCKKTPTREEIVDVKIMGVSLKNKKVIFFGDSYTEGLGIANGRFSSYFCQRVEAFEVNLGKGGTTLEKRFPVDYLSIGNMVDRTIEIPIKDDNMAMLVFAYGLNDIGQLAPEYNVKNYIEDYHKVIDAAFLKGWLPGQVLLISPFYINQSGYDFYAILNGTTSPTRQRHIDFVEATKIAASTKGTLYLDIFNHQLQNDTGLLVDGIHASQKGNKFIADDLINFLISKP
jgi:lysophospholipase L1-like esterase